MTNSDIHILPEDFLSTTEDTLIYFYSNNKSSVKNKVVFTKNMFCLLQHGIKEVQTATGKETVTNAELIILTSGSTLMSESVAENGKYEAILVFFSNKILFDFCAKQGLLINKQSDTTSILKISRDAFLNNFCYSLTLLRQQNNTRMDAFKVQEILGYIHASYPDLFQRLVTQALTNTTEIRLKKIVESNANKGLTLDELAFLCNMSVSSFKRHFAGIYHMPPKKYFTHTKMEQAKTWLSLKRRPSEIYSELGYENLSSFSHEFKKHFGMSPKQFQQNNELLAKQFGLPA